MSRYKRLSRVIYHHLYHIVWTPKYRYRILEGAIKEYLEEDIRKLSEWKGYEVVELNIQRDHIHMIISLPPKVSVSQMMGVLKGKTAIKLFKSYPELRSRPYWGNHFWARGYCSSTIGLDEEMIRKYVKYQEDEEHRAEAQQREFVFPPSQWKKCPLWGLFHATFLEGGGWLVNHRYKSSSRSVSIFLVSNSRPNRIRILPLQNLSGKCDM